MGSTPDLLFFAESAKGGLMSSTVTSRYPRPGPVGGTLIRQVIAFFKNQKIQLPITSHILIAVSGGSDSVGLAHLLLHYGRKIAPSNQFSLIHINHGWRPLESDQDAAFVQELGVRWGVPVLNFKIPGLAQSRHQSWEAEAREARKKIFNEQAIQKEALVFTAHQADDLAETLLWRLFTGAAKTHGAGITFQHGREMRPFLKIRKKTIQSYLQEVNTSFREDSTNFSNRFLRARMRQTLMPELESLFPQAIDHLVSLGLQAEMIEQQEDLNSILPFELLFQAAGLKARRSHFKYVLKESVRKNNGSAELHLPGGWKLFREKKKISSSTVLMKSYNNEEISPSDPKGDLTERQTDRWILEKSQ